MTSGSVWGRCSLSDLGAGEVPPRDGRHSSVHWRTQAVIASSTDRAGQRPNKGMNRSAEQRRFARCSVPAALRAPAPGYARRWAPRVPVGVLEYDVHSLT
jgi:hypothetical protein